MIEQKFDLITIFDRCEFRSFCHPILDDISKWSFDLKIREFGSRFWKQKNKNKTKFAMIARDSKDERWSWWCCWWWPILFFSITITTTTNTIIIIIIIITIIIIFISSKLISYEIVSTIGSMNKIDLSIETFIKSHRNVPSEPWQQIRLLW